MTKTEKPTEPTTEPELEHEPAAVPLLPLGPYSRVRPRERNLELEVCHNCGTIVLTGAKPLHEAWHNRFVPLE